MANREKVARDILIQLGLLMVGRIHSIDSLRAVAMTMVIAQHWGLLHSDGPEFGCSMLSRIL